MPVKHKGILIIIFGIYTLIYILNSPQVVGNDFCSSVAEHWSSNPEDAGSIPMQPECIGVAFFATGPDLGLIMYILTTLEFPKHNLDFHLLTTSVNAKYY